MEKLPVGLVGADLDEHQFPAGKGGLIQRPDLDDLHQLVQLLFHHGIPSITLREEADVESALDQFLGREGPCLLIAETGSGYCRPGCAVFTPTAQGRA